MKDGVEESPLMGDDEPEEDNPEDDKPPDDERVEAAGATTGESTGQTQPASQPVAQESAATGGVEQERESDDSEQTTGGGQTGSQQAQEMTRSDLPLTLRRDGVLDERTKRITSHVRPEVYDAHKDVPGELEDMMGVDTVHAMDAREAAWQLVNDQPELLVPYLEQMGYNF